MAKEKSARLEFHLKFNGRNPRHVSSARALASVDKQYKSSFIALAIEYYMKTHPMGNSDKCCEYSFLYSFSLPCSLT